MKSEIIMRIELHHLAYIQTPKASDVVVEPHNETLSIHQLLENSDETFVIENEVFKIMSQNIKITTGKMCRIKLANIISNDGIFTASLRLNVDLCKVSVNLVSFARADAKHVKATVQEMTHEV